MGEGGRMEEHGEGIKKDTKRDSKSIKKRERGRRAEEGIRGNVNKLELHEDKQTDRYTQTSGY